jgi:hypothetical protein
MSAASLCAEHRARARDDAGDAEQNMESDNRQKDGVCGWNLDAENVRHDTGPTAQLQ